MLLGRRAERDDEFAIGENRDIIVRHQIREILLGGGPGLQHALQNLQADNAGFAIEFNTYVEDFVHSLSARRRYAEILIRMMQNLQEQQLIESIIANYGLGRQDDEINFLGVDFVSFVQVLAIPMRFGYTVAHVVAALTMFVDQNPLPVPRMMVQGPYGVVAPIPGNVRELDRGNYIDARIPGMAPVPLNRALPIAERADVVANMYAGIVRPRSQLREAEQFQAVLGRVGDEVENGLHRYKEDILAYKSNVVYSALNALKRQIAIAKSVWGSEPIASAAGRQYIRLIQGAGAAAMPIFPISFKVRAVGPARVVNTKLNLILMNGNLQPGGVVADNDGIYDLQAQRVATTRVMVIGKLGAGSKKEYGISIAPYFGYSDPMFTPLKTVVVAADAVRNASGLGLGEAITLALPSANAGLFDRLTVNVGAQVRQQGMPLPHFQQPFDQARIQFYNAFTGWLDELMPYRYSPASPAIQVTRREILANRRVGSVWSIPGANQTRTHVGWIVGQYNDVGIFVVAEYITQDLEVASNLIVVGNAIQNGNLTLAATRNDFLDARGIAANHGTVFQAQVGRASMQVSFQGFLDSYTAMRNHILAVRDLHPNIPEFQEFDPRHSLTVVAIVERMWQVVLGRPANYGGALQHNNTGLLSTEAGGGPMNVNQFFNAASQQFDQARWRELSVDASAFRLLRVPPNVLAGGVPPLEIRTAEALQTYLRARLALQRQSIYQHFGGNNAQVQAANYPWKCAALSTDFAVAGNVKIWVEGFNNVNDYLDYLQIMSWLRNFGYSRKQEKAKINKTRISKFVGADSAALRKMVETFGGDASTIPGMRRG